MKNIGYILSINYNRIPKIQRNPSLSHPASSPRAPVDEKHVWGSTPYTEDKDESVELIEQ
ncbi:hypothetical protein LguiB_006543 [Lonicera macranthoides]